MAEVLNDTTHLLDLQEDERKQHAMIESLRGNVSSAPSSFTKSLISYELEVKLRHINWEGTIFRKDWKSSKWKSYFAHFNSRTLCLELFKSKEEFSKLKNPRQSIPVYWFSSHEATEDDSLSLMQMKEQLKQFQSNVEVCKYRVSVYAPKTTHVIAAPTDDDMIKWLDSIKQAYQVVMSPEELQQKKTAEEQLQPLLLSQQTKEREQYRFLVTSLKTAGIYTDKTTGKKREGYLEIQKPDGSWKKYYFVLFKDSLSYFNLEDKTHELVPRGVILLDSITSIRALPPQHRRKRKEEDVEMSEVSSSPTLSMLEDNMEIEESKPEKKEVSTSQRPPKQPFIVSTPLRTFTLRAKHEQAMKDWVLMINDIRKKKNPTLVGESSTVNRESDLEGTPIVGKILISYTDKGKEKIYKMKKNSIIIGRSTKADIYIPDPKLSRNHARIEINSKNVVGLFDLGSLGGSFVNDQKIIKVALKPEDRFQLGNTKFVFKVDVGKTR